MPKETSSPAPTTASDSSPAESESGSPKKKLRFAAVGLGHITQVAALPGFKQAANVELRSLVSGDRKKLATLKKRYGVAATYTYDQFDACLADPELDAVYIGLPNDQHLDCVLRAAAAGKHVLCEKPLALTAEDCRLMRDAAEKYGVRIMTAYRLHFEPATLATLDLVASGELGEVKFVSSSFSYRITDEDNIRLQQERGGGPVFDIGIYCINAARTFMRDEPIEVAALLARSKDPRFDEVEETAAVVLRFPRGRLASFVVSFGAEAISRLDVVGSKGRVFLEPAYEYSEALKQTVVREGEPEVREFAHTDQFGGEIEAFADCILEERAPEASVDEGLADVRVIEAIFRSAETGRSVRLKPMRKPSDPAKNPREVKPAISKPETVEVESPHD